MVKSKAKKITITQISSLIGKTRTQISCIKGLGLRKINHKVVLNNTPEIIGMIKKVKHMIKIEE
ncbi:MAG: 50S ribosomal protein L30 [Gammaproteobacteria bacterium]|nr:50S ribosomal protein L30 [Gammaproteobacteria bacterium]|tara:strand:+ start:32564 stop:32755 length:192 start_codon:yes stop_codon:yes gene_type:complete